MANDLSNKYFMVPILPNAAPLKAAPSLGDLNVYIREVTNLLQGNGIPLPDLTLLYESTRSSLVSSASVTVSNTLGANVSNITSSKDNLTALSESHTALISVAPVTANIPISQSNVKTHQASITAVTPISQSNVKVPQQTSIAAVTPLSQSNVKGNDHQSTRTVLTKHVGKGDELP